MGKFPYVFNCPYIGIPCSLLGRPINCTILYAFPLPLSLGRMTYHFNASMYVAILLNLCFCLTRISSRLWAGWSLFLTGPATVLVWNSAKTQEVLIEYQNDVYPQLFTRKDIFHCFLFFLEFSFTISPGSLWSSLLWKAVMKMCEKKSNFAFQDRIDLEIGNF